MTMVPDVDPHEEGPHLLEEDPLHQEIVLEMLMEVDGVEEMLLLEDHPPGACHLGVVEVEMSLDEMMGLGGVLLQGGISEIEMVVDHVEVDGILAKEEALPLDVWAIAPLDVDLLHEEIMAVMTIVEVHRLVDLHQIVMDG